MNNKIVTYVFFSLSIISLVISIFLNNLTYRIEEGTDFIWFIQIIFLNNALYAFLCSIFSLIGFLFWKYDHILFPYFTKSQKIIEKMGPYEIPPEREYIVKKVKGKFYVAYFLGVYVTESFVEKNEEEKTIFSEQFERAITNLKSITKFSIVVSTLDVTNHIEKIKELRSIAETKRSRLLSEGKRKEDEVAILNRTIAMYNRQLTRITSGERPLEILSYVMVVCDGLTLEEAAGGAYSRAREAKAVISSSLSCDVKILKDKDMLKCFEWEFMLPSNIVDLEDELF